MEKNLTQLTSIQMLVGKWVIALILMLLVFPLLGRIAPFIQTATLFGMVFYTGYFLAKRKRA